MHSVLHSTQHTLKNGHARIQLCSAVFNCVQLCKQGIIPQSIARGGGNLYTSYARGLVCWPWQFGLTGDPFSRHTVPASQR